MIIATGGEFVDCQWTEDGAFVCLDMDGIERVRLVVTGWAACSPLQRLALVRQLCGVILSPRRRHRNSGRRFDEAAARLVDLVVQSDDRTR